MNRTDGWQDWVVRIAEAGLAGDRQRLEMLILGAIRSLRKQAPGVSQDLGAALAQYSANPGGLRWKEVGPPPTDTDEGMALVRRVAPDAVAAPILPPALSGRVDQFVRERRDSQRLLDEGFVPPGSVLLTGAPGTGKTMLAQSLASRLELPFLVQDLATSISSFLGKTGFNLRRTLDYARSQPCVLLLDEFDAIAKKRDDRTEIGELKRIVNVLLKELEEWPIQSVLIAATNHPDLLDPAIRRRFHLVLDLPLPGEAERVAILQRAGGRFSAQISPKFLSACAKALGGRSGSDLESMMRSAVRKHLAGNTSMITGLLEEMRPLWGDDVQTKSIGGLVRAVSEAADRSFTVRELAHLFGKSVSTIQHHLKKEVADV